MFLQQEYSTFQISDIRLAALNIVAVVPFVIFTSYFEKIKAMIREILINSV